MQQETQTSPPRLTVGGREYQIKLTVARADAVQEFTGVDLIGDDASNALVGLLFDQRKLAAVLWQFCKSQAAEHQIDKAAFDDDLDSDTLTAGWGAVVDAVTFFTPSHQRAVFIAGFERQMAALEVGAKQIEQVIASEETTRSIEATMSKLATTSQAEITRALGESA